MVNDICIVGTGMIGRSFIDLCGSYCPEATLHTFDTNLEALTLVNNSRVHRCNSLKELVTMADRFVFCAAPWSSFIEVVRSLDEMPKRMIVGIARPPTEETWYEFNEQFSDRKDLIIPCIGLEPGLTEVLLGNVLDQEESWKLLEIQCGGIVLPVPQNPLKYKRLFGDLHLPFDWKQSYYLEFGRIRSTERFSGLELIDILEFGQLECYHDGLRVPLVKHPSLKTVRKVTQKTIRWPGHRNCLNILRELGMLSNEVDPIVNPIAPKRFFEIVNQNLLTLSLEDRTVTILRIKATNNSNETRNISLFFRDLHGQNSMALATCLPAFFFIKYYSEVTSIHSGVMLPESVIRGDLFFDLLNFLTSHNVEVNNNV